MMRNPDAKHLNFAGIKGVIRDNPKWLPSNIDMMAERNGRFLVCEWKREHEQFGGGQKILLKQLAKVPQFTVLIIQGNTDNEMVVDKFWMLPTWGKPHLLGSSLDEFLTFIQDWYYG